MADVVGDLVFDTTINSGQFDAGLAKLENNAKKAANNVDKAAQKVATLRQQLEELQAVAENEKKTRSTGTVSQETGEAAAGNSAAKSRRHTDRTGKNQCCRKRICGKTASCSFDNAEGVRTI